MGYNIGEQILKRGGYHAITVKATSDSVIDMFICRFEDGNYHLLGHRPARRSDLFSESGETGQDLGIVVLPAKKKKLTDLVKGEIIMIHPKERDSYQVEYIERCS